MRDGWTETTLGDVAEVIMGRQLSPSKKLGTRPRSYLRAANIGNWGISLNDVMQMDFTEDEEKHFASKTGDILMVEGGNEKSVGCPALVTEREQGLCIQNTVIRCRVNDATQLSSAFLYHSLRHNFWVGKFGELCAGTTIMHLGQKRAVVFPLIVPPLAEQKRIVDVVSSVDAYIDALQQQADSARTARNAVAEEAINSGFPTFALSQIGRIVTGSTPSTKRSEYWEPEEVDFITPGDFGEQLLIRNSSRRVSREGAIVSRALSAHSVLQVCIGATIGKVGYVSHEVITNQQINSVAGLKELDAYFVSLMLSTNELQVNIRDRAGTTTLPIISKSAWGELSIPWPDVQIRNGISLLAKLIDEYILATDNAVTNAKNLRSGLLSDLLSGEHEIPASYDSLLGAE
jgi:type I restriction enzyme S subunit